MQGYYLAHPQEELEIGDEEVAQKAPVAPRAARLA